MNLTQADHEGALAQLQQLVRLDSRSDAAGGCEGAVQAFMSEGFASAGAAVRHVLVDDLPGIREHPLFHGPRRDYRDRPTVIATFGNPDPDAPALFIAAHSDTVPLFAPDDWTVDPFAAVHRDGCIYGLGVSDDKWGLAAMLLLARTLGRHPALRHKRIIFASTIDEESGVGNGMAIVHLAGVRADMGLYLDGHDMMIARGNCGGSSLYLRPKPGVSAADLLRDEQRLAAAAAALARDRAALFDREGFHGNWAQDRSVLACRREDHSGPHLLLAFYTLPGEDPAAIMDQLRSCVAATLGADAACYEQSVRQPWFEPALVPTDLPILQHMRAAARRTLGREPDVCTESKIDAFVLTNHARIPTISFGPTMRPIGRGAFHYPDEYLTEQEYHDALEIVHAAVQSWLEQ